MSKNINSIRGKKLEFLAFLDFHQPQIVAIQETKIDSSISTSELFLVTEMGPITFESNHYHYHYIAISSLPLHTFWKCNQLPLP